MTKQKLLEAYDDENMKQGEDEAKILIERDKGVKWNTFRKWITTEERQNIWDHARPQKKAKGNGWYFLTLSPSRQKKFPILLLFAALDPSAFKRQVSYPGGQAVQFLQIGSIGRHTY